VQALSYVGGKDPVEIVFMIADQVSQLLVSEGSSVVRLNILLDKLKGTSKNSPFAILADLFALTFRYEKSAIHKVF